MCFLEMLAVCKYLKQHCARKFFSWKKASQQNFPCKADEDSGWRKEDTHFLIVDNLLENAFIPYIIFAELALRNVIAINWCKSQLVKGLEVPEEYQPVS